MNRTQSINNKGSLSCNSSISVHITTISSLAIVSNQRHTHQCRIPSIDSHPFLSPLRPHDSTHLSLHNPRPAKYCTGTSFFSRPVPLLPPSPREEHTHTAQARTSKTPRPSTVRPRPTQQSSRSSWRRSWWKRHLEAK